VTRAEDGGWIVRVSPDGMMDDANTLAHELSHARYFQKYGNWKDEIHGGATSMADGTPYGSGNALEAWIRGQR
jgi:hypothetical protein